MEKLTRGAIARILAGENVSKPNLQILAYRKVANEGQPRYRLVLSDGVNSHQCCIMMGNNLIERLEKGDFEKFTVIQLNKYVCNTISDKKVIIICEPEVKYKGTEIGVKLGNATLIQPPGGGGGCMDSSTPNRSSLVPKKESVSPSKAGSSYDPSVAVCDIEEINPYRNRWTIKGRITAKSQLRHWSKATGEGKVFSFDIQDKSGEIKVNVFNTEADRFYELIEVGKIYYVGKGQVKGANKKFNSLKHDYEITLTSESIVQEAADQCDNSCPEISYQFVKLRQIEETPADSTVDIVAVCKDPGEIAVITQKSTGKELKKRDISLVDDSNVEVKLTLWNDAAERFQSAEGNTVVAKRVRVSEFNGKSLSAGNDSFIQVDPQLPSVEELKDWYASNRDTLQVTSLTHSGSQGDPGNYVPFGHINNEYLSRNQGSVNFSANATIVQVGRVNIYMSCPNGCKKKVTDMNNGFFRCDKCNKEFTTCETRLILNAAIADFSGDLWVSFFHEDAEKLLGMKASEFNRLREAGEPEHDEVMASLNFKRLQFKLRAQIDHYKEETKIRTTVRSANPTSWTEYGRHLVKLLKNF